MIFALREPRREFRYRFREASPLERKNSPGRSFRCGAKIAQLPGARAPAERIALGNEVRAREFYAHRVVPHARALDISTCVLGQRSPLTGTATTGRQARRAPAAAGRHGVCSGPSTSLEIQDPRRTASARGFNAADVARVRRARITQGSPSAFAIPWPRNERRISRRWRRIRDRDLSKQLRSR